MSDVLKKKKKPEFPSQIGIKGEFGYVVAEMKIAFSEFITEKRAPEIYNGTEKIPFTQRHPIFQALMRIEFEDALKEKK